MKKINNILTRIGFVAILVVVYTLGPSVALALPAGFETTVVASGLNLPTTITFVPDGRVFIAEKGGSVRILKNGVLLNTPLITLSDVNPYGDRGLIGIAADPNFAQNGYLYLSYTYENTPGANFSGIKTARVVRVTVVGDIADESSKVIILGSVGGNAATPSCDNFTVTSDCIASDAPSHSIGGLRFGPDGKLYVATGDGAHFDYADTRSLRAQNIDSLAGKILRINTDGTAPTDNPFYNGNVNSNRSKVYAYGFRNSFRFNFRPSNGALYAGDVGWSSFEEVNKVVSGGNYGWPCKEGNVVTPAGLGCNAPGAIDPLYVYAHDVNGAGSVTAGAFPTGSAYPAQYLNTYFFGDYAQNWIKTMTVSGTDTNPVIANFGDAVDGTNGPVEFVTGPEGNIYFLSIYTGELKKITHTSGNRQPLAVINATPTSGLAPLSVNFSSTGSSDPDGNPITFKWNFGDNASSTLANPSHVYTNNGVYNATLTVFDNLGGQQTKSVSISVGNRAPTADIISPTTGSLYTVGQNLTLVGSGTDPEQGNLSASSMSWRVILHHNTHIHVLQTNTGNNIAFTGPDHADPDVYTEIELTVTDAGGLTNKKSINIYLSNAGTGNGNLVDNYNLETQDPQNPGYPANWVQDWWGNLTPVFTYPAAGYEGTNMRGAKVQITQYTSGDAKWMFSPISTQANTTYTFSDYYLANVTTTLVAQIGYINGTYSYINLGDVPANAAWTKVTKTFTTPVNARNVTVLHLIDRVGTLSVDNFSLTLGTSTPPTPDTTKPLVSITSPVNASTVSGVTNIVASSTDNVGVVGVKFLVDGVQSGAEDTTSPYSVSWNTASTTNGSHTLAAIARDLAGNTATSSNIAVTINNTTSTSTGPNLITNGTFEAGTTLPTGWTKGGWGTNTRTLTYPVAGPASAKAVRVQITAYPANGTGDAKWVHTKVAVTPGTQYQYSDKYRSNIISDVIGEYTLSNGTLSYFGLAKEIQPSNTWNNVSGTFSPPAGATHVTFYHLISSVGFVEIDDVDVHSIGNGNPGEIIPPVVEFTNPLNGQTVSGNVNITASSTDNVAVTYVFYAVDGNPITGQLTTSPYLYAWNTTGFTNGSHVLKATTHDPSGNNSTATITVNVNNSSTTPDTTKPLVSITSPVNASTVSGVTNIVASSTDNVGVVGVKFLVDGVQSGAEDTTSPYSVSWNTAGNTNGNHSLTAISRDLAGNVATSTAVVVNVNNVSGGDTTAPTVTLTSPTASSTVSGLVNMSANASDNVGVTGVQFFLDGSVFGAEDTTSPYTISWNTASTTNGTHSVSARARDLAGNTATTTLTNVVVSNVTPPTGSNMILNPSVETANGVKPLNWQNGKWGTNTTTFTYPTTGQDGAKAVGISMTAYTNGDAKWFFDDVTVVPGTTYTFSEYYKSNVVTNVTVRWTTSAGAVSYVSLGNPVASATFVQRTNTITVPAGVTKMTIFHILKSVGTLDVDNVSLTGPGGSADTTAPTVTLTSPTASSTVSGLVNMSANASDNVGVTGVQFFLDGSVFGAEDTTSPYTISWNTASTTNGTHSVSARARDLAGNTATTTNVAVTVSNVATDNVKPTVNILSPLNNSNASGTIPVTITANDNVAIASIILSVDGVAKNTASTSPLNFNLDTTQFNNGSHTVTARANDTSGNFASTSVNININNPVPDLNPPTISITSPTASSTMSGMIAVNINATDDTGVTSVHMFIDGDSMGTDSTLPYGASIDTTTLLNGVHIVTAYADDAAGNIGNANPIAFTVYNAPVNPPAPNTILNHSLETVSPVNSALPEFWSNGGWGTNNAVFTYPIPGIDGSRAARIDITSYTDGDAKWFFDDASTTPNDTYTFSEQYKSNVPTTLTARFTYADNTVQYRDIITLPASTNWNTSNTTIVIPPGAVKMTVFHILNSVGFLEIDNYYLASNSGVPTNNTFAQGMVSLTFDDGWLSQYQNARPILNNAHIKGGFYIISQETIESVPNNRLNDPNMEEIDPNDATAPLYWNKVKVGTNNAVFNWPVAGVANSSAINVTITSYTNGEAQWVPVDTTAISGQEYSYSGSYKSTVPTRIIAKYTLSDDSIVTEEIGVLAPSANWTTFNYNFYLHNNLKRVTVYHSLQSTGSFTLDNVDLDRVLIYMDPAQVQQMLADGHEVGAHTQHHPDLTTLSTTEANTEILGSRTDLVNLGLWPVSTFVYPYGSYNTAVKQMVVDAGYIGARSTEIGYNYRDTDKYALQIQEVNNTTTLAQFQTWVDSARNNKTWLILMFHQVDNQNLQLDVTPALLQQMVDFLVQQQVTVVTMQQGIGQMVP